MKYKHESEIVSRLMQLTSAKPVLTSEEDLALMKEIDAQDSVRQSQSAIGKNMKAKEKKEVELLARAKAMVV